VLDPAFIEAAIEAARAAGGIVIAGLHRRSPVAVKGFRDRVHFWQPTACFTI